MMPDDRIECRTRCQPILAPCAHCGGKAEALRTGGGYVVRCAVCGIRTRVYPFERDLSREWNRRADRRARVLSLDELTWAEFDLFDDTMGGNAAVWVETRADGLMLAALVSIGFEFGELDIEIMDDAGIWHRIGPDMIDQYGITWRIWDKKPAELDLKRAKWRAT